MIARWICAVMVGLTLFGAGNARAQNASPAAIEMARQIVDLKGVAKLFDPALTGMIVRARDTFLQTNPMLSGELDAVAQQLRRDFQPNLDALKVEIAKIYASHFTEQELKETLAFYKSPLGSKVLATEPKVLEQSMGYADKWAGDLGEKVLERMRAEMRKKGHDL